MLFLSCSDSPSGSPELEVINESHLDFNSERKFLKNGCFVKENLTNGFLIQLTDGVIEKGVLASENFSDDTSVGVSFYTEGSAVLIGNYNLFDGELNTISSSINCTKLNKTLFYCKNSFYIDGSSSIAPYGVVSISELDEIYTIYFEFEDCYGNTVKGLFKEELKELGV